MNLEQRFARAMTTKELRVTQAEWDQLRAQAEAQDAHYAQRTPGWSPRGIEGWLNGIGVIVDENAADDEPEGA